MQQARGGSRPTAVQVYVVASYRPTRGISASRPARLLPFRWPRSLRRVTDYFAGQLAGCVSRL